MAKRAHASSKRSSTPRTRSASGKRSKRPTGQDKQYIVSNPVTGESRTVTQREWHDENLEQAGWLKPADLS